jgi:uncharacterized protein YecT (DUF1311 family)
VSTVDIEACQGQRTLETNAKFNHLVDVLWPELDAKSKRDFVEGQRLWNRFEKDECDIAYRAYLGGSIAPVFAGECYAALAKARVREVIRTIRDHCGEKNTGLCARK